jgi:hypothetical protein
MCGGVCIGVGRDEILDGGEAVRDVEDTCRVDQEEYVLFGYPAAHEHDAEQAVRAGLELSAAVKTLRPGADVPMRCRVGIATGMVIVGDLVGVGELWAHRIIGDAPNLAARLQVSAQPDTVAIEPATRRLIGNLFDCCDLGAIATTSGTEPMRIWQVLGESIVASRFEALRGSALTRLVGRDEEIELLLRRWARAKSGDGQVVLISGEPGLGKSRITVALADRLHGESHVRLSYFCSPYHQDSAIMGLVYKLPRRVGSTTCPFLPLDASGGSATIVGAVSASDPGVLTESSPLDGTGSTVAALQRCKGGYAPPP